MILTIFCYMCSKHIIIRNMNGIAGMITLAHTSAGVNMIAFTKCYSCVPESIVRNEIVPVTEVERRWISPITDVYRVATPTMQLSYYLIPLRVQDRWEHTHGRMPTIWQVKNKDDWGVLIFTHEQLSSVLSEMIFSFTTVEGDTEVRTKAIGFLNMGRGMNSFAVRDDPKTTRHHCLLSTMCMFMTVIEVRGNFRELIDNNLDYEYMLFFVCCNECVTKYKPSYAEVLEQSKYFMSERRNVVPKVSKYMNANVTPYVCEDGPIYVDKDMIIDAFKEIKIVGEEDGFRCM